MRQPLRALAPCAALLLLLLAAAPAMAQSVRGVMLDAPSPIAPFVLEDQDGAPFDLERLKGRWSLVFLGFTHCPDVCPFTLANLEAVRAELSQLVAPDRLPQIVFLAVDPERDRPVLAAYVRHFGIDFVGVTGEGEAIMGLAESLDGFYRLEKKSPEDMAYEVTHSAAVSVVDPAGAVVAKLSPPFAPFPTATWLNALMRGAKGS